MYNIAILLTCFNRKQKTLNSLECLHRAWQFEKKQIKLSIYLTDDGSTDGTTKAVKAAFPEVNILKGNGSLYWAGGMRNSWNTALKTNYDAFLLLNDDTNVYDNLFTDLIDTHAFCKKKYGIYGIYVGSTKDNVTNIHSYGGSILTNRILAKYTSVIPNGKNPEPCELGNANIMWVSKNVVDKIGILSKKYIHGLADYDYTLLAIKNKLPVLITSNYLGECSRDHKNPYKSFSSLPIKERIKLLYNPIGLDFKSNLQYNKRNFPLRLPIVYITGWFKILCPSLYVKRYTNL